MHDDPIVMTHESFRATIAQAFERGRDAALAALPRQPAPEEAQPVQAVAWLQVEGGKLIAAHRLTDIPDGHHNVYLSPPATSEERRDAEMLDWLAINFDSVRMYSDDEGRRCWMAYPAKGSHPTVRAAIDAAMSSQKGA
jgi:hypothetical protein